MSAQETRIVLPKPTLARQALGVGAWVVGVSWMAPMLVGMTGLNVALGSHRIEFLNRLYCKGQIALTGSRWRAKVDPRVDPNQPYVFVQNHTNFFDHVLLYAATPHFKQGVELEEHFKIPVYGWFMRARGTIPVRRSTGGQSPDILDGFRHEVDRGHSILAFPEGTRTTTGRVGKFRKGIFYIARDLGLPVVPVTVTGAYELMHKGSWLINPFQELTVHVDAPVETRGLADDDIPALVERVQATVGGRLDAYWKRRGRS